MKQKIGKEIAIGFIIGVVSNLAGCYLYIFFLGKYKDLSFDSTLTVTMEQGLIGNVIVLGAILNLVVFFVFLKKNKYYRARGVILATIIAALIVLGSKFF